MKLFLTDVDGVLLRFEKGFADFLKTYHTGYTNLDYTDYQLGLSYKEMRLFVDQFNTSAMFGNLQPYDNAVEYVRKIHDEFGYKFVAITTCLGNEITDSLRKDNLKKVFGDVFHDVTCLPIHNSKKPEFLKYESTYWVDDKQKHVTDAYDAGHKAFQMMQSYNLTDPSSEKVIPVGCWKEIYEIVKKDHQ